ncbi:MULTISPECIES: CopD family protein [unclassified Streptomyces]|uniref:CopD family protein n=1 Tax=unclassified Streptomyces TaxID=2593676 RepID=UPI0008238DB9|nr:MULTISPECIES: CopD family protein [unclassified Streptomyces]MYT97465.1 copper resistance protein CopD [Streptomyces sp. SID8350]SCK14266.1 Putative copper export protein [Streptomyces sp. AmelKG-D3]
MFSGPPADPAAPTPPTGSGTPPTGARADAPAASLAVALSIGVPTSAPAAALTADVVPLSGEGRSGYGSGPAGGGPGRPSRLPVAFSLSAAALLALLVAVFGPGLAARGTGELRIPGAGLTTLLRTVLFAGLAVHLGELLAPQFVRTVGGRPRTAVRNWSVCAALAGAGAAAGQIAQLAVASGLGITGTYATRNGGLLLLIANGFVAAALCAASRRPALALAPLAVVVGAEAVRAHPEAYSPGIGAALTVVHLTAASLWAGGLLHVLRTMWLWRGSPTAARTLLARYARLAIWLYAALAATGTVSTLRRLPVDVVFTSAYGRTLLVKLALMAVVSVLALAARRRMLRDDDPGVAHRLARREQVVLGAVVVVSAILTVVPDPHWISLTP